MYYVSIVELMVEHHTLPVEWRHSQGRIMPAHIEAVTSEWSCRLMETFSFSEKFQWKFPVQNYRNAMPPSPDSWIDSAGWSSDLFWFSTVFDRQRFLCAAQYNYSLSVARCFGVSIVFIYFYDVMQTISYKSSSRMYRSVSHCFPDDRLSFSHMFIITTIPLNYNPNEFLFHNSFRFLLLLSSFIHFAWFWSTLNRCRPDVDPFSSSSSSSSSFSYIFFKLFLLRSFNTKWIQSMLIYHLKNEWRKTWWKIEWFRFAPFIVWVRLRNFRVVIFVWRAMWGFRFGGIWTFSKSWNLLVFFLGFFSVCCFSQVTRISPFAFVDLNRWNEINIMINYKASIKSDWPGSHLRFTIIFQIYYNIHSICICHPHS